MNTTKNKLLNIIGAAAIAGAGAFSSYSLEFPYVGMSMPSAYAATRYGVEKKDAKYENPAIIDYSKVMVESKYYKELIKLKENDTRRDRITNQLTNSVDKALMEAAAGGGYDIVVDKGDQGAEKYTDITASTIKKLQEKEKE